MLGSLRESGFLSPTLLFFFFPSQARLQENIFLSSGRPSLSLHFSVSLTFQGTLLFFISPSSMVGFLFSKETVRRGGFQHFINPCPCCLICYPFRFYGVPSFYVGRLRPDPQRPLGAGGNSSCSFLNSYSMCGSKPLGAYMALEQIQKNITTRFKEICGWLVLWPSYYSSNIYPLCGAFHFMMGI